MVVEGWNAQKLSDVADNNKNAFVDGPFGSNLKVSDYTDEGIPLIQLQNIGEGVYYDDNKKYTSVTKLDELRRHTAIPGDIVIAKMADPVARACIVPNLHDIFIIVADCIRLRVNEEKYDANFIQYLINSSITRNQAEARSAGTTRKRISLATARDLDILVPPLAVQKKIAEILESVDDAIAKTEAVIAQTQRVKQGLLQQLLTRGIGHTKFKQTPLGEIPESWEVIELNCVASNERGSFVNGPFGSDLLKSDLRANGVPVIYIRDIKDEKYQPSSTVYVSQEKANQLSVCKVIAGDIVITKVGDPPGIACIYPQGSPNAIITQDVIRIKTNKDFNAPFVKLFLNSQIGKDLVDRISIKGTRKRVSLGTYKKLPFPKPDLEEQIKISGIIIKIDKVIAEEHQRLLYMRSMKMGLMSDLLTGRVRVNVDVNPTTQNEVAA